ncbi:MAG: ABC transporter ATP-binding protein [Gemmatimonadota bacterium]
MLELAGLWKTFNRGTPGEQLALAGIDLVLEPGAFVVVLGINGSGKSTLLNAIAGTVQLDRGEVRLAGQNVTPWPEHRRAALIGRVFQDPFAATASRLTVAQNLALAANRGQARSPVRSALRPEIRALFEQRVKELRLGLEDRLDARMGDLSGGQRQALTLLMATLVRPTLLLLDEHTANLDPTSADHVLGITEEIVERHKLTTLMVTHSMHQAVTLGNRVLMMHRGRIAYDFRGPQKRSLRVDDLRDCFEALRTADLLDESAAEMLRHIYV